uniref:Ti plasmid pTi15955 T-DNA region n=1 Tax=Agrobacterium tumefaciens TaxID=358 RepID=Q44390_AGRTU|nr:unnamed protein product [Agrobacterium tumefaciens]
MLFNMIGLQTRMPGELSNSTGVVRIFILKNFSFKHWTRLMIPEFTWRVAVVPSQVDGWRVLFRPRVTPSVQLSTIVEAFWQRAILSNTLGRDITTALEISLWILLQVLQVL